MSSFHNFPVMTLLVGKDFFIFREWPQTLSRSGAGVWVGEGGICPGREAWEWVGREVGNGFLYLHVNGG